MVLPRFVLFVNIVWSDNGQVDITLARAIAARGDTLDELLVDTVAVLREYAQDWVERLHLAPNHANNWALLQLVALSNDEQIRDRLQGSAS